MVLLKDLVEELESNPDYIFLKDEAKKVYARFGDTLGYQNIFDLDTRSIILYYISRSELNSLDNIDIAARFIMYNMFIFCASEAFCAKYETYPIATIRLRKKGTKGVISDAPLTLTLVQYIDDTTLIFSFINDDITLTADSGRIFEGKQLCNQIQIKLCDIVDPEFLSWANTPELDLLSAPVGVLCGLYQRYNTAYDKNGNEILLKNVSGTEVNYMSFKPVSVTSLDTCPFKYALSSDVIKKVNKNVYEIEYKI